MMLRTFKVISVTAFWLVHFVGSFLALGLSVVGSLHPEDFSDLQFLAAQVVLFPLFNLVTKFRSPFVLAAINSSLWAIAFYGLMVLYGKKVRSAAPAQESGE